MTDTDFHSTLERLRAQRDEIEQAFDSELEELDRRIGAARAALERAAELAAATGEEGPRKAAGASRNGAADERGVSGIRSRLAAWLVGDRLTSLERRCRELEQALSDSNGSELYREHVEAVRELAGRATEAAETGAGLIRALKSLLNAKEAETVHVASHGARAQAELTLQELARQQEALLSELIDRRQKLDRRLGRSEDDGADEES